MSLSKSFSSENMALWLSHNFKALIFFISLLVFGALAFIGWKEWKTKQENKIQNSLYEWQKTLKDLVKTEEDKNKKSKDQKSPDVSKEEIKLSFTQEMKDVAQSYSVKIQEHKNSIRSVSFAIDLADFYYRRGEKDQAMQLLSQFAWPSKKSTLYHLASFQLAGYYMDNKAYQKALDLLSALVLNERAKAFHLESQLQKALCFESMNDYDKALQAYTEVEQKDSQGYIGRLAQDYKRLLFLKRKLNKKEQ